MDTVELIALGVIGYLLLTPQGSVSLGPPTLTPAGPGYYPDNVYPPDGSVGAVPPPAPVPGVLDTINQGVDTAVNIATGVRTIVDTFGGGDSSTSSGDSPDVASGDYPPDSGADVIA